MTSRGERGSMLTRGGLRLGMMLLVSLAGLATWQPPAGDAQDGAQPRDVPRGRIAYIGEDGNIWVSALESATTRQLTRDGDITQFAWSPAADKIAYLAAGRLKVVDARGTIGAVIEAEIESFSWSPKGDRIVYVREGTLRSSKPDGSDTRDLATDVQSFSLSPTGDLVAYFSAIDGDPSLHSFRIVRPDGTRRRLGADESFPGDVVWSPDGGLVAYSVLTEDQPLRIDPSENIVAVSTDDLRRNVLTSGMPAPNNPTRIEGNPWRWFDYVISDDGETLFASGAPSPNCGTGGCQDRQLFRIPLADPRRREPLLPEGTFGRGPYAMSLSPSGEYLSFTSGTHAGGCQDAAFANLISLSSKDIAAVPSDLARNSGQGILDSRGYAWSPRADVLAVAVSLEDWAGCARPEFKPFILESKLLLYDAREGGVMELAATEDGEITAPVWSADGKSVVYQLRGEIWAIPDAGGDPVRLGRGTEPAVQPTPERLLILVHGVGSDTGVWGTEDNSSLLQYLQFIYGEQNVSAFDYGDEAPGTPCRAQGDIESYARKLADDVRGLLAAAREETGRDDLKVDFVVHSMGGLIVRRYLQTQEGRQSTGRVVLLHTPHQGSYIESVQALQDNPVTALLLDGFSATVGRLLHLDFDCPAHRQMQPGSGFLTNLNQGELPDGIEFSNFFSNIRVTPYTSVWGVELPLAPFNVGDTMVTLADSRLSGDCVEPNGFLSLLLADPQQIQFACADGKGSGATLGVSLAEARVGLPDLGLCAVVGQLCAVLGIETVADIEAVLDLPQSHSGVMMGIVEPGRSYRLLQEGQEATLLDIILAPPALAER